MNLFLATFYRLTDFFRSFSGYTKQNQGRTLLASTSIVFGMCILTVLLAAGDGMESTAVDLMSGYSNRSVWFYGGVTSEIGENVKGGKSIFFDQTDLDQIKKLEPNAEVVTSEVVESGKVISNDANYGICALKRVGIDYFKIKRERLQEGGRFFDVSDKAERRRVCLIGKTIGEILFPNENPLGKYVKMDDNWYLVIGVLKEPKNTTESVSRDVFIPSYTSNESFSSFGVLVKDDVSSKEVEKSISEFLAEQKQFIKDDKSALFVMNYQKQSELITDFFDNLSGFNWFIGICLLVVAIIGCTNIMVVIVKERTTEIGIRKAIGANPRSILQMMLFESLIIIVLSGTVGVIFGHIIVDGLNLILSATPEEERIFSSMKTNDAGTYLSLAVLVVIGTIGSVLPAVRASRINPISAINQN